MSFFAELKRRNVFRVGIAYALMGWVLLQGADFLLDLVGAPEWVLRTLAVVLVIGLPVALFFAWAYEMTPEGIKRETEVDRTHSITSRTGRKLDYFIIGILLLVIVSMGVERAFFAGRQAPPEVAESSPETEPATPAPAEPPQDDRKSIAVLPFANMSEDSANEYFSDGISEEILNALAKVKELKVAGRTSSFAFKGRNEDLRLIGETLGVDHILEGSVRKAGNTVRITAQLIQADDGFHLWSETYDRELDDIFAIQDEIAAAILDELKAELIGTQSIASARTDTDTYQKFLVAKQRIYSRNVPEMKAALELLDEVIAADPEFAPAQAARGVVTMFLSDTEYGDIPYQQAQSEALAFLDRALALDPDLAEAWAGKGLWLDNQPGNADRAAAREHLQKALSINPALIDASNWLQNILEGLGEVAQAQAILEDMFQRDPLYPPAINNLIFLYGRTHQLEKAENALARVRPFQSGLPNLSWVEALQLWWLGQFGEGLKQAERVFELTTYNQSKAEELGLLLWSMHEFERVLDVPQSDPGFRVEALRLLGRTEEATIQARDWADIDAAAYLNLLANTDRCPQFVDYVRQRWTELHTFSEDTGGDFGFGARTLTDAARCFRLVGDEPAFEQAMALALDELESQMDQGADNAPFWINVAEYWTLADDWQRAIDYVERAVERHWPGFPLAKWTPTFEPLRGDPRFEAAQQRALAHVQQQRVIAGLAPLDEDGLL